MKILRIHRQKIFDSLKKQLSKNYKKYLQIKVDQNQSSVFWNSSELYIYLKNKISKSWNKTWFAMILFYNIVQVSFKFRDITLSHLVIILNSRGKTIMTSRYLWSAFYKFWIGKILSFEVFIRIDIFFVLGFNLSYLKKQIK